MDAEMKKAERVFKTAVELDAKNIRMFSFYLDEALDAKQNRDIVYSSLERMVKLASKYGVTLCHENEAKIYGESPEACREILDYFGGELKCVFDMGNFALEGYASLHAGHDATERIAIKPLSDGLQNRINELQYNLTVFLFNNMGVEQ